MPIPVPLSVDDITEEWVTAVLSTRLDNASVDSVRWEKVGVGYGLSSDLYRAQLQGADCPDTIAVKLWSTDKVAGTREVPFYLKFGDRAGIPIPLCYHAAVDPERQRGVLVVEDVRPAEQGDCLDIIPVERAVTLAKILAHFHRQWWENTQVLSAEWLPSVREVWRGEEWLMTRRSEFLERFEGQLHPGCRLLLESVQTVEHRSNEILREFPETLLHTDLHLDNILFRNGISPVILDWARVARGPAVIDLGELVFGMGQVEQADTILAAYISELHREGMTSVENAWVRRGLTGVVLRRFVTWTCGLVRWTPASVREERMIAQGLSRIQDAVLTWLGPDPLSTLS